MASTKASEEELRHLLSIVRQFGGGVDMLTVRYHAAQPKQPGGTRPRVRPERPERIESGLRRLRRRKLIAFDGGGGCIGLITALEKPRRARRPVVARPARGRTGTLHGRFAGPSDDWSKE